MTLKDLRKTKKLTQKEAASICEVSLRTYKTYENDTSKSDTLKYRFMSSMIEQYGMIDEQHGILSVEDIRKTCGTILSDYPISYCYLFGSYAKGTATNTSDIDLLISEGVTGLSFFGLAEKLREELKKQVDLLDPGQLTNNPTLLNEILKDGVKIYG